jgi:AraC-like DNA-binding protein
VIADLLAKSFARGGEPGSPPTAFACLEQLFDHLPETVFFLKDAQGRYVAVNQTLVVRCGVRAKGELIHRQVQEVFPRKLAEGYAAQDRQVLQRGAPILERLELHWYERRRAGWCLTTKLPLHDAAGRIAGLVGISRDLRVPDDRKTIPPSLATTLEHLETHFADPVSPASLARQAGLSAVRFARLIKRIHRLTPHELIVRTRLAAATRLLRESDRSVAEIALACGFYDHSAFTRAFRCATHSTPSQFRAAQHEAPAASAAYSWLAARLRYSEGRQPTLDLKALEKMRGLA